MAKFDVALCTDNAAFAEYTGAEVARILRALADEVEGQLAEGRFDILPALTDGDSSAVKPPVG